MKTKAETMFAMAFLLETDAARIEWYEALSPEDKKIFRDELWSRVEALFDIWQTFAEHMREALIPYVLEVLEEMSATIPPDLSQEA